ncbi:MAG: thioredoxin domain-containing protein [Parcubacteria group bacterium]|nr:thioredoxin domain-containing protein [Parcubacteria group bacterium]
MEQVSLQENKLLVPLSIIIAGVIIAGAIIFTKNTTDDRPDNTETPDTVSVQEMRSVDATDHLLGNINTAEVFIVEFSDLECPFCKHFHETLKQVMEEYGPNGKVAWVYRHFPLTSIHPKATKEAEATECAAELGGELKFWEYTDQIFKITPSNNGLDLSLLPLIAENIGLNKDAFLKCLESGRHVEKINADTKDAIGSGGRGTPHTIVITKDGTRALPISGAQTIEVVRSTIEQLLGK